MGENVKVGRKDTDGAAVGRKDTDGAADDVDDAEVLEVGEGDTVGFGEVVGATDVGKLICKRSNHCPRTTFPTSSRCSRESLSL